MQLQQKKTEKMKIHKIAAPPQCVVDFFALKTNAAPPPQTGKSFTTVSVSYWVCLMGGRTARMFSFLWGNFLIEFRSLHIYTKNGTAD